MTSSMLVGAGMPGRYQLASSTRPCSATDSVRAASELDESTSIGIFDDEGDPPVMPARRLKSGSAATLGKVSISSSQNRARAS